MVTWPSGIRRLRHRTDREVVVTRVEDFSDRYRRIHFTGDDLLHDLTDVYPTAWVRLWVPESPAGADAKAGDGSAKAGNGDAATTDHPGPARGSGRVSRRDYTFVDVDIRSGSFALDLVLPHHRTAGEAAFGPATRWAQAAQPGTVIDACVTPDRLDLPRDTKRLILLGDLSTVPAVNSWLSWIPDEVEATAIIEDDGDTDGIPQRQRANATWTWVRSTGSRGQALIDHVRDLGLGPAGLYVWVAGERGLVSAVRHGLRRELPLDRRRHFSQAYWSDRRSAHVPAGESTE